MTVSQKDLKKKIKHRKLSVTIELISFGKHGGVFPLTKPLISCLCHSVVSFFFLVTQTFSYEWSRKDHFFLCYYSISTKPKLYNHSLPFPMPSQTHKPLSLNTLTLISQIFQSMIQRGHVCFRDQKPGGKKRIVRTQMMEKSKYVRN